MAAKRVGGVRERPVQKPPSTPPGAPQPLRDPPQDSLFPCSRFPPRSFCSPSPAASHQTPTPIPPRPSLSHPPPHHNPPLKPLINPQTPPLHLSQAPQHPPAPFYRPPPPTLLPSLHCPHLSADEGGPDVQTGSLRAWHPVLLQPHQGTNALQQLHGVEGLQTEEQGDSGVLLTPYGNRGQWGHRGHSQAGRPSGLSAPSVPCSIRGEKGGFCRRLHGKPSCLQRAGGSQEEMGALGTGLWATEGTLWFWGVLEFCRPFGVLFWGRGVISGHFGAHLHSVVKRRGCRVEAQVLEGANVGGSPTVRPAPFNGQHVVSEVVPEFQVLRGGFGFGVGALLHTQLCCLCSAPPKKPQGYDGGEGAQWSLIPIWWFSYPKVTGKLQRDSSIE